MLDKKLFASMREGATFINTGRGAQVIEADLIAVLKARPDLTALLDVTWPEPPAPDSELWRLPNVVIIRISAARPGMKWCGSPIASIERIRGLAGRQDATL